MSGAAKVATLWYNGTMSKKDKIDKSIAFHQAIMLTLYATFIGLVGYIYENADKMSTLTFWGLLVGCIAFILIIIILYFIILRKINELEDL